MDADELGQYLDDTAGAKASSDIDGETFPRVFIYYRQTLQLLTVGASIKHKVVCPQVPRARCRQRARAARRNSPSRPLSRHLQTV